MNACRDLTALLLALMLAPGIVRADDAMDLEQATDQLVIHPDQAAALRTAGLAAFRLHRDHLALYYLDRLLAQRPDDEEARRCRNEAARNAGLPANDPPPARSGPVPPRGFFVTARPFFSVLAYGGDSQRTGGDAEELDVRVGQWSRGHVDLALAQTHLRMQPPLADYDQQELKVGAGWMPTPGLLLRGRYGRASLDGEDNDTEWVAAGVDLLRAPHLLGLEMFAGDYPTARTLAVTPQATVRMGKLALSAALAVQRTEPDEGDAGTRGYAKGQLEFEVSPRSTLTLGGGAGHQSFAVEGPGDIVFNLPEEERADGFFSMHRRFGHLVATWKSAYYAFDPAYGDAYHSTVHTLSLGYDSNGALRPPPGLPGNSSGSADWFFSAGVQQQQVSLHTTAQPIAPLVTSVTGPYVYGRQRPYQGAAGNSYYLDGIVYYDPFTTDPVTGSGEAFFSVADGDQISGGTPYGTVHMSSQTYSYRTIDDFHDTESSDDENAAGPSFTLRRVVAAGAGIGSLQLAGRYGYVQVAQDGGRQLAARQTVWQDVQTRRFSYPVSLGAYIIWDTDAFTQKYPYAPVPTEPTESASTVSTIYEDYTAYTQTRLEAGLHRLSLSLEWADRPVRWCELAVAAGPVLMLTDWRLRRSTEWESNKRGLILTPADEAADGLDSAWGFGAAWAARFLLPGDQLYLELAGHYADLRPVPLRAGFAESELDLDDWSGSAGVGFSL